MKTTLVLLCQVYVRPLQVKDLKSNTHYFMLTLKEFLHLFVVVFNMQSDGVCTPLRDKEG